MPQLDVCCYSLGLQYVGRGRLTLPSSQRHLESDGKWYAAPENRNTPVPTDWIKKVVVAARLADEHDEVVAVDCRDFHDPERRSKTQDRSSSSKDAGSAAWGNWGRRQAWPDEEKVNHLGVHHTVMQGLTKHGANVWRRHLRRKEKVPFGNWVCEFVLGPLWNAVRDLQKAGSAAAHQKKIVMVFFCRWGRHRSVALEACFLRALPCIPWAQLKDASHLASESWLWSTCNFCDVWTSTRCF